MIDFTQDLEGMVYKDDSQIAMPGIIPPETDLILVMEKRTQTEWRQFTKKNPQFRLATAGEVYLCMKIAAGNGPDKDNARIIRRNALEEGIVTGTTLFPTLTSAGFSDIIGENQGSLRTFPWNELVRNKPIWSFYRQGNGIGKRFAHSMLHPAAPTQEELEEVLIRISGLSPDKIIMCSSYNAGKPVTGPNPVTYRLKPGIAGIAMYLGVTDVPDARFMAYMVKRK